MDTPTAEQRLRFEKLCLYRSLYARRGSSDRSSVLSIAEATRYAVALLTDGESLPMPETRSADSTV